MSKTTGTIIKYVMISIIIFAVLGALGWKLFFEGKTIEQENIQKLPQCSDGEDNDGDGLSDSNDPQCLSPEDKWERDYSWLKWIFGGIIGFGIIIGIWYFISKNKPDEDKEGINPEPIKPQRGLELAVSSLLKYKFKDIPARVVIEKDGYDRWETMEEDIIEYDDMFPHTENGQLFQFVFIKVNQGRWAGNHLIAYPLSKGEEFIKGGVPRFESHAWLGNWTRKSRTFRMSSPDTEKARLELLKLEAIADGDKEALLETDALLKSLGSSDSKSAFVDEDDEEYKERLRLINAQNNNKKKNTKKRNTQTQTPEMNFEGGDEE